LVKVGLTTQSVGRDEENKTPFYGGCKKAIGRNPKSQ